MGYNAPSGGCLIGREPELELLADIVKSGTPTPAVVLTGGPGVGKTALWEVGVSLAREFGFRILAARPSEAEAQHPFAALFDLLDEVSAQILDELPVPQRRALEAALLRSEPADMVPEPFAIAAGLLGVLRSLAAAKPLLLAIDDLQWLDRESADALAFAARRLHGAGCRFLLARRSGQPPEVEQALGAVGVRRIEVGPLSLEATYRLLYQRLDLSVPPRTLSRLFEATRGIPLLVLELGHTLAAQESPVFGADVPIADLSSNPFGPRVAGLPRPARRALLAVALSGYLSLQVLEAVADRTAVENLVAAGILVVDDGRVRPSHPLLAAAVKWRSTAEEKQVLHRKLARSAGDQTVRAKHLALAATGADAALASLIAAAAKGAFRRGAAHEAVDLAEHALRLTPPAATEVAERLLVLAEYLVTVGEPSRARELLLPRLAEVPAGPARAHAHMLLADAGSLTEHENHLERALAETQGQPELRATALAGKSILLSVIRVERIGEAEDCAQQARALAMSCGAPVERQVLQALAWARVMRGNPLDDLAGLSPEQESPGLYENSIDRQIGVRLVFRGQVGEARSVFQRLTALADARGEARFRAAVQMQLCEAELRSGHVTECARLVDQRHEWAALDDSEANWARCRALLAAIQGLPEDVARWATVVADIAAASQEDAGLLWDELEVRRAQGIAALLTHRPDRAAEVLGLVWEHTRREGVEDPGAFPVAPDLVEALVRLGRVAEAAAVTGRLRDLASRQDHPWGLATADRCAAAIVLARTSGFDEGAASRLAAAAATMGELDLGFDRARSLLWLGQAARRARKRAAAANYLSAAATAFAALGSDGWAELAQMELVRLGGGKRGPAKELTAAELRVATLAAEGLSNKEIARRLFIAVHTVEVHLGHTYAKLGVRSRTQLANHLARPPGWRSEN